MHLVYIYRYSLTKYLSDWWRIGLDIARRKFAEMKVCENHVLHSHMKKTVIAIQWHKPADMVCAFPQYSVVFHCLLANGITPSRSIVVPA
jgi:hypothetical protein